MPETAQPIIEQDQAENPTVEVPAVIEPAPQADSTHSINSGQAGSPQAESQAPAPAPAEIPKPETPTAEPPAAQQSQPQPSAQMPMPLNATAPVSSLAGLLQRALAKIQFRKRKKLGEIIALAKEKETITNDDVQKLLRCSDATATRYLAQLVKENALKREGKNGGSYYRLF